MSDQINQITQIPHPNIDGGGSDQQHRVPRALAPSSIQIDGRKMEDLLDLIFRFGRQLNFFDEQLQVQEWRPFFENSLPFLIARIKHFPNEDLEQDFHRRIEMLVNQPHPNLVHEAVRFLSQELVFPLHHWLTQFKQQETQFGVHIEKLVSGNLHGATRALIELSNGFSTPGQKVDFRQLLEEDAWGLELSDLFSINDSLLASSQPLHLQSANLKELLEILFHRFGQVILELSQKIKTDAHYLEEALRPLQEKYQKGHAPQLGLLFAFLHLFEQLQGDLNQLSEEHLKFFFRKVLNLNNQPLSPDQAHLVLQLQKNLDPYKVPKGTLVKGGKDTQGKDILFQTDEDIVLDHAKIGSLRTLYRHPVKAVIESDGTQQLCEFTEAVYATQVANSADGKGKTFPAGAPSNWATLGAKESKYMIEVPKGESFEYMIEEPLSHPYARLGFVLASPVLLLGEGKRKITATFEFKYEIDEQSQCIIGTQDFGLMILTHIKDIMLGSIEKTNSLIAGVAQNFLIDKRNSFEIQKLKEQLDPKHHKYGRQYLDLLGKRPLFFTTNDVFLELLDQDETKIFTQKDKDIITSKEYEIETGEYSISFKKLEALLEMEQFSTVAKIYFECLIDVVQDSGHLQAILQLDHILEVKIEEKGKKKNIFEDKFLQGLREYFIQFDSSSIFDIAFSGKEGWIKANEDPNITLITKLHPLEKEQLRLDFEIELSDDAPAITYADKKMLLEDYGTILPLIKFRLKQDIQLPVNTADLDPLCELGKLIQSAPLSLSLYYFFSRLAIAKIDIQTDVCGVRNLVVQNEDALQDVNGTLLPFGSRPTINSDFYIGSKEVFLKKWDKVWLNINWKDKPVSFTDHYNGYQDILTDRQKITDEDFKMEIAVLQEMAWKKEKHNDQADYDCGDEIADEEKAALRKLFESSHSISNNCTYHNLFEQVLEIERQHFDLAPTARLKDNAPLIQYESHTQNGFLRLRLKCEDFQHKRYPFILARQMMAFGKFPEYFHGAVYVHYQKKKEITSKKEFEEAGFVVLSPEDLYDQLDQIADILFDIDNNLAGDHDHCQLPPPSEGSLYERLISILSIIKGALSDNTKARLIDEIMRLIPTQVDHSTKDEIEEILNNSFGGFIVSEKLKDEISTGVAIKTGLDKSAVKPIIDNSLVDHLIYNRLRKTSLKGSLKEAFPGNNSSIDLAVDYATGFKFIPARTTSASNTSLEEIIEKAITHIGKIPSPLNRWLERNVEIDISSKIRQLILQTIEECISSSKSYYEKVFIKYLNQKIDHADVDELLLKESLESLFIYRDEFKKTVVNQFLELKTVETVSTIFEILGIPFTEEGEATIKKELLIASETETKSLIGSIFNNLPDPAKSKIDTTGIRELLFDEIPFKILDALFISTELKELFCGGEYKAQTAIDLVCNSHNEQSADVCESDLDNLVLKNQHPDYQLLLNKLKRSTVIYALKTLKKYIYSFKYLKDKMVLGGVVIPNEPYTPIIKQISLDYTASATQDDIQFFHLYPFAGTSQQMNLEDQPSLIKIIEDQGTLFIGLNELNPGSHLHLLFQFAEATADTEIDRPQIKWAYLKGKDAQENEYYDWASLQPKTHILADETENFSTSGIVKIQIPDDIVEKGYTIMPPGFFWLKAAVDKNVKAVAETINIHPQAVKATYQARKENERPELELEANALGKLLKINPNVKKVAQPYTSFAGRPKENNERFYRRVSEHLRHKGRGITLHDYERLILEQFPTVYRAKCLNHTFGLSAHDYRKDVDWAPGFVLIALTPDLHKIQPGDQLAPRVPASHLEKIKQYLEERISPFIRLKVMNPRYEPLAVELEVAFQAGQDINYHKKKLQQDLKNYLVPWHDGASEKLAFGRKITRSEIVHFIETRDYVDYIKQLVLKLDLDLIHGHDEEVFSPFTPRSILTAGDITITAVAPGHYDCTEEEETAPTVETAGV